MIEGKWNALGFELGSTLALYQKTSNVINYNHSHLQFFRRWHLKMLLGTLENYSQNVRWAWHLIAYPHRSGIPFHIHERLRMNLPKSKVIRKLRF